MGKIFPLVFLSLLSGVAAAAGGDPIQVDIRNLVKVENGTTGQCTITTTQRFSTNIPVAHFVHWVYVTYRDDDEKEQRMAADLDASQTIYSGDQAGACAEAKGRADAALRWMRLRFNDIKKNNLTVKGAGACSAYFFVATVKGQVELADKTKVDNVELELDQRAVPCPTH